MIPECMKGFASAKHVPKLPVFPLCDSVVPESEDWGGWFQTLACQPIDGKRTPLIGQKKMFETTTDRLVVAVLDFYDFS